MDYIILTNTFRRSIDLVERSLKSSLNQKIEPQKVILIDQNDPPLKLSKDVKELFEIRAQELGVINPFEAAQDTLDQIAEILEMTSFSFKKSGGCRP